MVNQEELGDRNSLLLEMQNREHELRSSAL